MAPLQAMPRPHIKRFASPSCAFIVLVGALLTGTIALRAAPIHFSVPEEPTAPNQEFKTMELLQSPPLPAGIASSELANDYHVTIDGHAVFTHAARVSAQPFNQVWAGYQRPLDQTESSAFASWEMTKPVEVEIWSRRPIHEVRVRPSSRGIEPTVAGDIIRFQVAAPGQYTVEVNGTHCALHLFADPPEAEPVPKSSDRVRVFGPGEHFPGLIRLASHETLYLAAGAIVYGAVLAENGSGITIRGRGILDGSGFERMDLTGLICLYRCRNVRIEGITLRDSSGFTVVPIACADVHIQNIKIIGNWRYNTDGIDFVSSSHCTVEDSFLRTFDDSISIKGYSNFGPFIYRLQLVEGRWDGSFSVDGVTRRTFAELQQRYGIYDCGAVPISDIHVRNCVIWNDWGRALEIGAETVASEISDVSYENCDIVHVSGVAMDIQNCDRAVCRDIRFKNIRVELDDDTTPAGLQTAKNQSYRPSAVENNATLICLEIKPGYASNDTVRGQIQDVQFQDITVTSWGVPDSNLSGFDADHAVDGVSVSNLGINGRCPGTAAEAGFSTNQFVPNFVFNPRADSGGN